MRPGGWRRLRHLLHDAIDWLFDFNLPVDPPPAPRARPVPVSHRQIFGGPMSRFGYTYKAPTLDQLEKPEDVVGFRLFASANGSDRPPVDLPPGAEHEVEFNLDEQASVRFKAVDAAGNESTDSSPAHEFTVVDDVPPSPPSGAPVLVGHRQIFDAAGSPVEPTPEPTEPTEPPPTEPTTEPTP